jgi:hypothetical protein
VIATILVCLLALFVASRLLFALAAATTGQLKTLGWLIVVLITLLWSATQ